MDDFSREIRKLTKEAMSITTAPSKAWESNYLEAVTKLGDFALGSDDTGNVLALDFLKHAILAEFNNMGLGKEKQPLQRKWKLSTSGEMPQGLDYPEFTANELARLYSFVDWVAANN